MKTPISYFLLALTALLSVATTVTAFKPVLDTDGDVIFTTGSYYVLPFIRGHGGGVTLAGRGDKPCPLDVVQESSEVENGLPVKFSNWKIPVAVVPQNTNLNIETDVTATICMRPTYWWVGPFDNPVMDWILTTGPKPEGFGEDLKRSFFQIEETEDEHVYKFMFCPSKEGHCSDVGIIVDENGVRRLGIKTSRPFLVQFKKANVIQSVVSEKM